MLEYEKNGSVKTYMITTNILVVLLRDKYLRSFVFRVLEKFLFSAFVRPGCMRHLSLESYKKKPCAFFQTVLKYRKNKSDPWRFSNSLMEHKE